MIWHLRLTRVPDPLKEKWGERKIEIHPTIPTLVDLDEWFRARLHAKTLVSEPLPSLGKPWRGRRSGFRTPPRKGDQGIEQHVTHLDFECCSTRLQFQFQRFRDKNLPF